MTPTAIRTVTQLRQEFYSLFAAAMKTPVTITSGNSSTGNPSMVYWSDSQQWLNYLYVYAHTAPDALVPGRPFVLRLAINKNAGAFTAVSRGKSCRGLNRGWRFELTLLPEEILDFLPWVVQLIKSYDCNANVPVLDPPYPLESKVSDGILLNSVQTYAAGSQLIQRTNERSFLSLSGS
jgi:hypothetical protein